MIIWRGQGALVFIIVFCSSLVANIIFNATFGDRYYDNHLWPLAISLLVSAAVCWRLARHLRNRKERVVIDKETGEEMILNQSDNTLFFIPVDYWAPILVVIALVVFAAEFIK